MKIVTLIKVLSWYCIALPAQLQLFPTTVNAISYDYNVNSGRYQASPQKSDVLLFSAAAGALYIANCVKIIHTGNEALVERLGAYHRKLDPGIHLVWSPFERICFEETIREQVLDVPPQECFTLDNAPLRADAIVYMRVCDTMAACYKVINFKNAILSLCLTMVREEVGKLTLEETFASRNRLNKVLVQNLNEASREWGVEITRVEIQDLQPSHDILKAMEMQMSADRKKRAVILQSQGERKRLENEAQGKAMALISDAEAKKKGIILAAEAEVERQRLESEGLRLAIESLSKSIANSSGTNRDKNDPPGMKAVKDSLQLLSLIRYLETHGRFAESSGTKVLMFPSKDSLPLTYEGINSMLNQ